MKKEINLCLNYHDFSGTKAKCTKSNYTVDFVEFLKQLDVLKGKKNLNIAELNATHQFDFSFSLTFDDGYKSNLYIAEQLAKRDLSGTFFIIKDKCLNDSAYLNKEEIRELSDLGMDIGSHSCTHRHMNRLNYKDLIMELHDSKSFLEDVMGRQITSIAFPGGQCGKREFTAALQQGYLINRTTINGLNYLPIKNSIVRCITIKNQIDIRTFSQIICLSPGFFFKTKFREIVLEVPKFIESKYKFYFDK